MNRFREALSLLPKRSFVGLLVLAVLLVWSLTYSATIEYIRSRGGVVEEIGHMNVLISTLDGTVLTFSLLVYLVAGVVPFVVLMFRPKKEGQLRCSSYLGGYNSRSSLCF